MNVLQNAIDALHQQGYSTIVSEAINCWKEKQVFQPAFPLSRLARQAVEMANLEFSPRYRELVETFESLGVDYNHYYKWRDSQLANQQKRAA
jgi:hypothetical protein